MGVQFVLSKPSNEGCSKTAKSGSQCQQHCGQCPLWGGRIAVVSGAATIGLTGRGIVAATRWIRRSILELSEMTIN